MKIFTCIKYVPDTSEAEVKVCADGLEVDRSRFSFDINDADNYAVEEAILTKEAQGGTVSIVSIGPKESEVMIRMALAKGGDSAIRIEDSRIALFDPLIVARVLAKAIKGSGFDLIFTGCMAGDDGYTSTGVALAEMLGVPHASMVKKLEFLGRGWIRVYRELEGGLLEVVELETPAVITVQTGINEPRYAPIRGIREAQKKELRVVNLDDLGIPADQADLFASKIVLEKLYIPQAVSQAEVIEGDLDQKAEKLASILVKGGLV